MFVLFASVLGDVLAKGCGPNARLSLEGPGWKGARTTLASQRARYACFLRLGGHGLVGKGLWSERLPEFPWPGAGGRSDHIRERRVSMCLFCLVRCWGMCWPRVVVRTPA